MPATCAAITATPAPDQATRPRSWRWTTWPGETARLPPTENGRVSTVCLSTGRAVTRNFLEAKRGPRSLGAGVALFALNAFFCFPLFRTEYLDDFHSNEGYWIAIARFLTGHWPHVAWLPWYDAGKPLEAAYLPLVHTLTALGAWLTHASPALTFHVLAALAYCLAPVSLFAFAAWVSGRATGAFSAALLWSLFSPSVMLPMILADSGSAWVLRRLNNIVFYGETPHNVAIALVPLALLLLARYLKQPGVARFAMAALAFAAVMMANAFGVVLAGVSAVLLLAAADRPDWRGVLSLGGIVAAAYLLICRALPPSLIRLIETNSQTVGGDFRFTSRTAVLAVGRRLQQTARQVMRFRQQKETDLRHVRAGGDVDEVILSLGVEGIVARKAEERFVNLLEVPWIAEFDWVQNDLGFRRNRVDVAAHLLGHGCFSFAVQQLETIHDHIRLLTDGDRGAPVLPAVGMFANIERGSKQANDDNRVLMLIHTYKSYTHISLYCAC